MTPRHILPTALFLAALSCAGTWIAIDAADREQQQAERARISQVITEPTCWQGCPDCPIRCEQPPVIREASVLPLGAR